jgi:hypothetical protein
MISSDFFSVNFWIPFMKRLNTFYFLTITASLVGCGGGGSSGIKNESANGVWVGFSTNNQAVSSEIVSVYYDDKYVTLNTADQKLYSGSYTVVVDNITSQDSKSFNWDGSYIADGSMTGTVYTESTILSTYTGDIEAGSAELEKNSEIIAYETSLSDKSLNNNKLKGSWITNDADNKLLYAFAIDNGNFSAEASDGCSIDGDLNIPNGNLNVFQLTLVISGASCSYSGDYTGLGYLKDDKITFAYSNDNYGFVLEAEKFGL